MGTKRIKSQTEKYGSTISAKIFLKSKVVAATGEDENLFGKDGIYVCLELFEGIFPGADNAVLNQGRAFVTTDEETRARDKQ